MWHGWTRSRASEGTQAQQGPRSEPGQDAADFELITESNFSLPNHSQPCNCSLCMTQQIVVITNDLGCLLKGKFRSGQPEGKNAKVQLQYVVMRRPPNTAILNGPSCLGGGVISQHTAVLAAAFHAAMPAGQLMSTNQGRKVAELWGMEPRGTFHTYIRAQVTCTEARTVRSFHSYSLEVYVAGSRQLRRIPDLQRHQQQG